MIHVLGIDHIVLRVQDAARMTKFYCDVLGCTVERARQDIGLIQLRAGQSMIDLVPVDGELGRKGGAAPTAEGRNLDHFCVRVEPWDPFAVIAHLIKNGVVPGETKQRYGADGLGPSIYINDPEGNVVELKGPSE